jgi:uncharacterized membrane protein
VLHALLLHLISLTVITGGMIGSVTTYLTFRKAVHSAPPQLPGLGRLFPIFGIMTQAGLLLMIISGLLVMKSREWGDWGQTWLTVKLVLVLLLFLNAHMVALPISKRMGQALANGGMPPGENPEVLRALRSLGVFWMVQVTGMIVVICLAVLKP